VEVGEARRVVVAQQGQPFSGFHTSIAGAASNRVIVASHSVMVCIQGIGDFRRGCSPISDLIDNGRYTIAAAMVYRPPFIVAARKQFLLLCTFGHHCSTRIRPAGDL
jgi:hypothetical protein